MNYFDIDSLPGKILGNHHFEYNHASLVIFSRRTMRQCQAARIARIQAASTGGICPCLRRVAGCATPTGSTGHAGATASLKLTLHLAHSVGANHRRLGSPALETARKPVGGGEGRIYPHRHGRKGRPLPQVGSFPPHPILRERGTCRASRARATARGHPRRLAGEVGEGEPEPRGTLRPASDLPSVKATQQSEATTADIVLRANEARGRLR